MNMVGHASDPQNRTIEAVADPAEIMLHLIPNFRVLQERPAILCRKNQVQVNLSKRLRHGSAPLMLPLQGRSRIVTPSQGALRDPGLCEKTPLGFGGPGLSLRRTTFRRARRSPNLARRRRLQNEQQ